MEAAISVVELQQRLAAFPPPTVIDVRRKPAFNADPHLIPGAIRRAPEDMSPPSRLKGEYRSAQHEGSPLSACVAQIEPWRAVVVYCVHGHEVGQDCAKALRERGLAARYLEGGLTAWREAGGATVPFRPPTRWVTRARPKIDRIACPWLVRRFIDPSAEFFYVPSSEVEAYAAAHAAQAYDVPDVAYTHVGPECSFDAFLRRHALADPALAQLATIVRAADTGTPDRAAPAPGLLAASLGLSAMFSDDHTMLKWGMLVYDSLYAWCRTQQRPMARAAA